MTALREATVAALDALAEAGSVDPEAAHAKADELLLEYVDPSVAGAYLRVMRACAWWGCS